MSEMSLAESGFINTTETDRKDVLVVVFSVPVCQLQQCYFLRGAASALPACVNPQVGLVPPQFDHFFLWWWFISASQQT